MKYAVAATWLTITISVAASHPCLAEPVLMLNEPRDVGSAEYLCDWAEKEIKADQYLIKAFKCAESDLCQRAIDLSAACKVSGPAAEVRAFHTKLLAQFASNAQCGITIMRVTEDNSTAGTNNDLEAYKRATWELNLGFRPGASQQEWALWPRKSGEIVPSGLLEGKGDPGEIARDVCTIITGGGAKIVN